MVGDVWVCTGQSNMEFGATRPKSLPRRIIPRFDSGRRQSNSVQPVAVKYGFMQSMLPVPNLYNKDGLPASPFRTDEWPVD